MTQTGERLARQWQSHFEGRLLTPEDSDYPASRRIWNQMIDKRPLLIARCVSPSDVCAAVKLATSEKLPLSVRGGGHGVAGTAVCDNGLMIDLSLMKNVRVDPPGRKRLPNPACFGANSTGPPRNTDWLLPEVRCRTPASPG